MKDLLTYILSNIIDNPESLAIDEEQEGDITRFNVTLAESDYPKVIGKGGMTIKSITDIIRLSSSKSTNAPSNKVFVNIRS